MSVSTGYRSFITVSADMQMCKVVKSSGKETFDQFRDHICKVNMKIRFLFLLFNTFKLYVIHSVT